MSDTGGGHRSAAQAIVAALAREFPNHYTTTLVDVFKRAAIFPLNYAPETYLPFTTYFEWLWGLGFRISSHRLVMRIVTPYLHLSLARGLRAILREQKPDLIVSTHPIFVQVGRRARCDIGARAPFITVVTDLFDAHGFWFDPQVDLCIVPTEGARAVARHFGMPDQKLRVVGLPIGLEFLNATKSPRDYRTALGLMPDGTTVLLVGGGEGMGKLYEIARALDAARLPIQLVIIAGRNQRLREKLRAATWQMPVHVQGFVTNMSDWMRASDLIITKAGPSTIMEALACGLPILLSGFLPGQERGNARFVETSGVGVLCQDPQAIARTVGEWLSPGNDTLARFAARARQLAQPRAAIEVAKILDQILVSHFVQKFN